jgi:hypothetical protein
VYFVTEKVVPVVSFVRFSLRHFSPAKDFQLGHYYLANFLANGSAGDFI